MKEIDGVEKVEPPSQVAVKFNYDRLQNVTTLLGTLEESSDFLFCVCVVVHSRVSSTFEMVFAKCINSDVKYVIV